LIEPAHTINVPETNRPGSVGRPIPGCSVKRDTSVTLDGSSEGEIIAYGPNVMAGYHNLPAATREVLQEDGGLRTGDLGRLDQDGYLYITGRIKEQYKLENGILTPTLKLKRREVHKLYGDKIEALYA
jgi:long-chain acyl-CoA synthetase